MSIRSAQEIWEAALGELQIQVNKSNYRTWLKDTVGLSLDNGQFVVGVPNTFVAEYLERNQRSLIEKTLIGITKRDTRVVFEPDIRLRTGSNSNQEESARSPRAGRPKLNPKYTLGSFVTGPCNGLAHAAALKVVENPGQAYNPLFIYGGVGLGKTHLLHAIGHAALANNAQLLYVTAEQFTNEFVNAIRHKRAEEFHNRYRNVDMLLIDDINFIGGKEQTEESFFHTFNVLHDSNRQIVVTSDCPPKSMTLVESRLLSRFEWGLTAQIQPPDLKTRIAILQAKAEQQNTRIPSDVLKFIASQGEQNVRELEGSLNRVIAYARLVGAEPTPELAAEALVDLAKKAAKQLIAKPTAIIEAVASSFGVTPEDLKGRKRDKKTALARQTAMYIMRQDSKITLADIGKEVGTRNHSSVLHACDKVTTELETSPSLRQTILNIRQNLYR